MKPQLPRIRSLAIDAAVLAASSIVLYGIFLLAGGHKAEVSLLIGAIIATETGVVLHHRQQGAGKGVAAMAALGGTLALATCAVAGLMELIFHWMKSPTIGIPVTTGGAFVLPFLLFRPMWNALERNRRSG